MCGIIGYTGSRNAAPFLLHGLSRLEYRGYDSAGVATIEESGIVRERILGKPGNLEHVLRRNPLFGTTGIGHNRWATHGKPSQENAHPHISNNGRVAVVHNGTIENHNELRAELEEKGFRMESETDTEVIAHLVEHELRQSNMSLQEAVEAVLVQLRGTYGLAVISADCPGEIVAARLSSPLFLGFGAEGILLSSDEVGFNGSVSGVLALRDGDIATLHANGSYALKGVSYSEMQTRVCPPSVSLDDIDRGGHPHLMLKEILEQPDVTANALRGRVNAHKGGVKLGGIERVEERFARSRRIVITACGTSYHAALAGKRLIEGLARIPVEVAFASEFFHEDPILDANDTVVGISQSGATFDTLRALELAKKRGALALGITNRVGSELAELTDAGVYLHVGPECAVASTKAYTGQCAVLTLIALRLAHIRGTSPDRIQPLLEGLELLPEWMAEALKTREQVKKIALTYQASGRAIFIGRGHGSPLALEAALKLKEIAYVDTHGYPAGELKHGPLALIEEGTPVIAIAFRDSLQSAMFANMEEAKSRGARIIALATRGDDAVHAVAHHVVELPDMPAELAAIVGAVPLQLLAYEWGVAKGCDVDQPRNLAKSVTVG